MDWHSFGDHTGKETPVPIPNTAVKLSAPVIVPASAKVGIARFYFKNPVGSKDPAGFLLFNSPPLKGGAGGGILAWLRPPRLTANVLGSILMTESYYTRPATVRSQEP